MKVAVKSGQTVQTVLVVLVVGMSGVRPCDELVNMKIEAIEDMKSLLYIEISKTYKARFFTTIVDEKFLQLYRKYASLRPKEIKDSRFFFS
ncbi:hypothetical protein NQ317_009501 [Molorchus minor]|uniref:Secreted protein n=1 Tax=Molorchus minor TaxID=1323400 RepID=A0ABQ9IRF6_9CUCU|nr:hypothetical protein NQ317_009501 [Molorchus minor]